MKTTSVVIAQTSAPGTPAATGGRADPVPFWAQPIFPILLIAVVFYLFLYRNKRNTDKQRTDMLTQLKRGDRIQTIGGILGTVTEVRDHEVVVKVDESSNTKLRFTRNAIHKVVAEEGKNESK